MSEIQNDVKNLFEEIFSKTPLNKRLDDIFNNVLKMHSEFNPDQLKTKTGDILTSLIMLCEENGWQFEDVIKNTLNKIINRKDQYKSLKAKTRVGLFGGGFDPITNGHIQASKFVLDSSNTVDEVWLMPCYSHMYGKQMQNSEHRLEMCRLAAKVDGRIKVFDYEISKQSNGEMFQTITNLLNDESIFTQYDLSLIIGMDNANTFEKWKNYELLEQLIRFIIVPRKGHKIDNDVQWYKKEPHIFLGEYEKQIDEISSTKFRSLMRTDIDQAKKLVGKEVYNYIFKNRLYNC